MRLILAELKKIKRHYLLSFSMIIVLFSALLAMFQLVAASGTVRGYLPYYIFWRVFDKSGIYRWYIKK